MTRWDPFTVGKEKKTAEEKKTKKQQVIDFS